MASFNVQALNEEQEPVSGTRVVLEFTSILRGMTAEEYTDSDGYANFDGYEEGEVKVYVNGSSHGTYYYRDGNNITRTI